MKILNDSTAYQGARSVEIANNPDYDHHEKKLLIRFEAGVDFSDFVGFERQFLSLITEDAKEWAQRQVNLMRQLRREMNV